MDNFPKLAICGIFAIAFGLILTCMGNHNALIMSSSAVGAGMFMVGIGSFAGGFPELFRASHINFSEIYGISATYIVYVAGFVFLTIIGFFVQRKLTENDWVYEE